MSFYAPLPKDDADLQQGDILQDVPFGYYDLFAASVKGKEGEVNLTEIRAEDVMTHLNYSWGLILSQTCDVQRLPTGEDAARKPILVARVVPAIGNVKDFSEAKWESGVKGLANPGKWPNFFYLPPVATEGIRMVADLSDVQRFGPKNRSTLRGLCRFRMSPPALQAFQERCAYFFGRFAAPGNLYYTEEEVEAKRRNQNG